MQNNHLKDKRPRKPVELNYWFCTLANRLSIEKTKTISKKEVLHPMFQLAGFS
jgi:hypothetical protein